MAQQNKNKEINELSLLFDISRKLNETMDIKSLIRPVLEMMAEKLEMMRGTVTILNRKTGELFIEEAYGLSDDEREKGKYKIGEGVTGKVFNTGKPVVIPRISDEPMFLDKTGSRKKLNKSDITFICVPVIADNEVIGTLSADRLFSDSVALDEDLRLLTIIASIISQGVRLRQIAGEEMDKLKDENMRLTDQLREKHGMGNIIGNSKIMQGVYSLIEKVASTNTTVLILGESGVGKEKYANAIHFNSNRANAPLVKVNCAALPESLIESELFGHEKGSFTGAMSTRKGRFELADNGTIFLDEVGELPLSVQVKLLRVIQEREFERVGGSDTIKVNVRIIAATNRDMRELICSGKFREDLYYRLNVFPIIIPPLRERKTDIMLIADYFVEKYSVEHGKKVSRISTDAINMLVSYHWPGNVRELENCIERAVILSNDGIVHGYHLPPSLQTGKKADEDRKRSLDEMISKFEEELIIDELKNSSGNIALAARSLSVSERIMGLRIAKYGIDVSLYKN
ncbi:MAG TPA: sigma 54-interacting transcriptional regulator [Spirochaetota bacterium]|nr:sigma 54-interacting transcriptional regulator [Spirochaetota bacterium]